VVPTSTSRDPAVRCIEPAERSLFGGVRPSSTGVAARRSREERARDCARRRGCLTVEPVEEAPPKKKRFSMLRTFVLADAITLGNAAAGMGAIMACLRYVEAKSTWHMWLAFGLMPVALFCDFMDGNVARWRRKQSPLGADLDSLADIISFGVAPAVLGFSLGLRGTIDALVLIYFVCCGISRLARYNVTAASLSDESGKVKYYEGTPIPTSLSIVLAFAIMFGQGHVGDGVWLGVLHPGGWEFHPIVLLYAISGSAMISATLKIPKP
jgi:CDP-diacylglycerol--serine O-phosphatidyltransferase